MKRDMENRFDATLARNIGDILRKIRTNESRKNGEIPITQNDVACYAEISLKHYQNLELGKCLPSFDVMMRIARGYHMLLSEFFAYFEIINK